ncbi:Type IV leader peptidase family protein [Corynebacterium occultum]|uniref:Type IV leader peptidase family protein n=1 Tax=Corynebacterium occultum TaxID=2675219 RepID=A0A6B8W4Q2_9CORY|nr:prepilin peptidase [Corynebacterium occultum]QGU07521.1 Type IV leader peptidase family protein [Corynebacterium occultum]
MIGSAVGAANIPGVLIDAAHSAASMSTPFLLLGLGCTTWAIALCVVDLRQRRLPDALTLPAIPLAWGLALLWQPTAVLGGVGWALFLLLIGIWLGGVGGGDIKLAASLGTGVVLGAGFGTLPWVMAGAAGIAALIMLLSRRESLPFGPAMLLAAGLGILS